MKLHAVHSVAICRFSLAIVAVGDHPVYVAERRRNTPRTANPNTTPDHLDNRFMFGLIALLSAAPMIVCFQSALGASTLEVITNALAALSIALCILPTAVLAGLASSGIARERAARTWDLLLTTTINRTELMLYKALGAIPIARGIGVVFAVRFGLAALLTVPMVLNAFAFAYAYSHLSALPLALVAIPLMIIDHLQEAALAVLVGIMIPLLNVSRQTVVALAFLVGLLIRLLPMALVFTLVTKTNMGEFANIFWMNLIMGSTTLLLGSQPWIMLGALLLLLLLREILIIGLFRWAVRHASGS